MSVEDDIKQAELDLKLLDIQQKQSELKKARHFDITRAAVVVTFIGSVAAVAFQTIGFYTSLNEKAKAETEKQQAEIRAEAVRKAEFDFRGVELFLKEQSRLITCDRDESLRNLQPFQQLFTERVVNGFNEIAAYRGQKCVTDSENLATTKARNESKTEAQVRAAADAARYAATAQQAPLLAAGIDPHSKGNRVFIHINSEADRPAAAGLQAELARRGYSVPGIERVSSAPDNYQVRYYYTEQQQDASALAAIAEAKFGLPAKAIELPEPLDKKYKSLPSRTMEFWFPRRASAPS
jgi:hypothetical protein